jgi:nitrate reductase NapE component
MSTQSDSPTTESIKAQERVAKPTLSLRRAVPGYVLAIVGTAVLLYVAGHSGGTLDNPVGSRAWELAMTAIAVALLIVGVVQSIRAGKLSRVLLMVIATGSAFWQETYGDWGTYLLYSPRFATYEWGDTIWTSPVRCWWFLPGYVFFYTTFFLALQKASTQLRQQWPHRNPYLTTVAVAFPLFYIFDMALEGAAHGFGWWQYQYAFGPSMAVGTGQFPLLWPILEQVPFMVTAVFALTWRNTDGEDVFEVAARIVTRKVPGQFAILMSWVIIVNVSFLVETILPLMALRWIAGPASAVVP